MILLFYVSSELKSLPMQKMLLHSGALTTVVIFVVSAGTAFNLEKAAPILSRFDPWPSLQPVQADYEKQFHCLIKYSLKGQMNKKIVCFSSVVLPSPNTKMNHPKWDLGKDFSSQAFIDSKR